MKIMVISPFVSGPSSGNGGGVLTFCQIKELTIHHEVSFLSSSGVMSEEIEAKCIEDLKKVCKEVNTVPLKINRFRVIKAIIWSIGMAYPKLASLCWLSTMQYRLREQLKQFRPDIVWIQFPQMAQYVQICGDIRCIMDVQDVYSLSGFRQAQKLRGVSRILSFLDWVCWARYEAHYYSKFATVLTLSEQDAVLLKAMSPQTRPRSIGMPLSKNSVPPCLSVPYRVGFAGAFNHRPNLEGLTWFLETVWPLVRFSLPNAKFMIAGRNPPQHIISRMGEGAELSGFVPNISDFFASNAVTVVPLLSGGGVKIKTIESMLAGSAIVATSIGAEGIGISSGQEVIIADDPVAFAKAIVLVLEDPGLRARLGNSAQSYAKVQFSTDAWRQKVEKVFSGLSD